MYRAARLDIICDRIRGNRAHTDFCGFRSVCPGCTFVTNRRITRTLADHFYLQLSGVYFVKRRFLAKHLCFRILGPLHVAITLMQLFLNGHLF